MEYKVFYRKYRPDSFKGIIGQEYSKNMLQNAVKNQKISHAYIFTGPRGTGKTSTAKIFAKAINCEHPIDGEACGKCTSCLNFSTSSDIIEIDAASNNGVDEVRELINNIKIAPTSGKYKIYIIDEVHMMTQSAFNALLLTLEEPPAHVIFIMATTNIESVPITILSRCQRFDFKKFTVDELKSQILYVCAKENINITDDAALEIAYISEGGMRDALSLLDQLSANSNSITIDNILSNYGSISNVFIKKMVDNLFHGNISNLIEQFDELKNSSNDYKIFIKKIVQELIQYAIRLKSEYLPIHFTYEQIKNLVFDLNECMNRSNININPFDLIELTMLNYISPSLNNNIPLSTEIPDNTIELASSEDIHHLEIAKDTENNDKLSLDYEDVSNSCNVDLDQLKKVRVNNCFCEAKKQILNDLKLMWNDLASSPIPDDILGILIDSNIVAASDRYAIIACPLESNSILINKKISEISDYLCEFFDKELLFIALSQSEWNIEKENYVHNIKAGVTYQMMEEPSLNGQNVPDSSSSQPDDVVKVAQDIFEHDKIEIV